MHPLCVFSTQTVALAPARRTWRVWDSSCRMQLSTALSLRWSVGRTASLQPWCCFSCSFACTGRSVAVVYAGTIDACCYQLAALRRVLLVFMAV
jgi:hypothetical protein